jgi:glycosyltransferase involved in cell wall biosynthesis
VHSPRVVHLATSLSGGAGIASRRIVEAQVNSGIDAHLYAANYSGAQLDSHESILRRGFGARAKSKSLTYFQTQFVQNSDLLVTSYSSNATKDWKALVGNPDVIHLHAFYNLLKLDVLNQLSEVAPLVITMHDQRVFTGGCHYSGNCEGYKRVCVSCPQVHKVFQQAPIKQMKKGKDTFNSLNEAVIISPSQWLANLASESALLCKNRIEVLNNPVPAIFTPNPRDKVEDNERLVVGFISENLHNPYKGFQVLVDALNRLPQSFEIEVKFMGKGSIPIFLDRIKASQSHLNNPAGIAREIRSCDAIIVPSLQDNSPSVISESIMCGVPVIGSRVGGITEIVTEFNLPSFEKGDSEQLSKILLNFKSNKQFQSGVQGEISKFSYEISATKHLKLYKSILR